MIYSNTLVLLYLSNLDSIIPFWKHCLGDTIIILFYNVYILAENLKGDHVEAGTYSIRLSFCCMSWCTLYLSNVHNLVQVIRSSERDGS